MEKSPVIPPNFVTLRDLKERREREQVLKQQSTQVEKEEESEVKGPQAAPVKQEGSFDDFPPKPPKYTTNQNRRRGGGRSKQTAIISAQAAVNGSTSLKHTTNQNRSRGWRQPKQSTIIGAQAAANGSASNAEKEKESNAEVAGVITELSFTGLGCGSEVAMCMKRTKATSAVVKSIQVGKEEKSEVKPPPIAPVHIKEEEKQEGSIDNFPPKPPKYTTNQNLRSGGGHPKQTAIIGAQAAVNGTTSLKLTTNQNRSRGWRRPKQSTIIGAQAVANGSTSNAEKKESDAEVAGIITELSLTGLGCGSEVAIGEKRMKATAALVNGGKTEGRAGLDIERRISGLHINGRNSNFKAGGRGYGNNWQKSSSSAGKVWVVKKSLNQKAAMAKAKQGQRRGEVEEKARRSRREARSLTKSIELKTQDDVAGNK